MEGRGHLVPKGAINRRIEDRTAYHHHVLLPDHGSKVFLGIADKVVLENVGPFKVVGLN